MVTFKITYCSNCDMHDITIKIRNITITITIATRLQETVM